MKKYVEDGLNIHKDIYANCPTRCITWENDQLVIDNANCVKCMHCINVMTKALSPGDDHGVTVLIGGKRTLKIGDTMGTVIVPFMKLESDEDYEKLVELANHAGGADNITVVLSEIQ